MKHLLFILLLISPILAEDRVALIIGNGAYQGNITALKNPPNDVDALSVQLQKLGFTVISKKDQTRAGMKQSIRDFRGKLTKGSVGVFFFSGHGLEVKGKNYFIPIGAEITKEYEVAEECISANLILSAMEESGSKLNMVLLDCCRSNPFAKSWRSVGSGGGLAMMDTPEGTLLCYAAGPSKVAYDGRGKNSPFVNGLVSALAKPGINHNKLFQHVKASVYQETGKKQTPWTSDDLKEDFFFNKSGVSPGGSNPPVTPPSAGSNSLQAQAKWKTYMQSMEADFTAAQSLASQQGWQSFLASYSKTRNPYSTRDEEMLRRADIQSKQSDLIGSKAGERREFEIYPGEKVALRWIPATGEKGFMMGSPANEVDRDEDETQHKVILSKGFWMAETETTQGLWEEVMGTSVAEQKVKRNSFGKITGTGKDHPMYYVSYIDIKEFIKKVNDSGKLQVGMEVRLPTEAEWEYACRAGTSSPFHTGGNLTTDQANYDGDYPYNGAAKGKNRKSTIAVGSLSANAWGLHDMHGNVMEWCSDWYGEYKGGTERDPRGANSGNNRVLRGGSWGNSAKFCRSAYRNRNNPSNRYNNYGFRLVIQVQ